MSSIRFVVEPRDVRDVIAARLDRGDAWVKIQMELLTFHARGRSAVPFDESKYREIKAACPGSLLLCRMGNFYELFFEDAEVAAKALRVDLAKRVGQQGGDIPMCGAPFERAQDYHWMLISLGHRVAVCERGGDSVSA